MWTGYIWLRTAGSCERRNEPSVSIVSGVFLKQLSDCKLLNYSALLGQWCIRYLVHIKIGRSPLYVKQLYIRKHN